MGSITKSLNTWFLASRPKTLIASISPTLIGNFIALKKGVFSLSILFLTLSFAILIQIGTNFANDYFDYLKGADTEKRKGPKRIMQMNLVSERLMKTAIILVFLGCLALGVTMTFIGGYAFLLLSTAAILIGTCYTAGPFPLAYLGLGDIFVLIFFGPIAALGCNYLQTEEMTLPCFIAGLGPGLFSCAILCANNIRDIEEDRISKKKTLAVRFGKKFAVVEYICCVFIALLIPIVLFFYEYTSQISFANVALSILLIEPIRNILSNNDDQITQVLPKTAYVMTLYSLIFSLSILM